jgi:hypothetical protein
VIQWRKISEELPPEGEAVNTKIDDARGPRNEQLLVRVGRLFYYPDHSMYVYYTPTHWHPIPHEGENL